MRMMRPALALAAMGLLAACAEGNLPWQQQPPPVAEAPADPEPVPLAEGESPLPARKPTTVERQAHAEAPEPDYPEDVVEAPPEAPAAEPGAPVTAPAEGTGSGSAGDEGTAAPGAAEETAVDEQDAADEDDEVADAPVPVRCDPDDWTELVGQPTSKLTGMRFPRTTRFIGPLSAATADHSADRLNVEFNKFGIVTRVWCG